MRVEAILRERGRRVVTIATATTVQAAARLLKSEDLGAVVVRERHGSQGEVVLGVLSERDIVRALADHGGAALDMAVSRLMSRAVVTCGPRDEAAAVVRLMQAHQIRHVPVMEGDTLIGVISIRDVLARPEADRQERHGPLPGTEPSHLHQ